MLATLDGMVLDFQIYSGTGSVSEADKKEYGMEVLNLTDRLSGPYCAFPLIDRLGSALSKKVERNPGEHLWEDEKVVPSSGWTIKQY